MDDERTRYGKLSGRIGIVANIILAVSKLVIGLISGMVSIVADSVNNFSDASSSIVSLIGFKLASKPADDEHPFGHARYEYISGLVVAFLVMIAGVELLKSSFEKILNPTEIDFSVAMFIVLVISILVKIGLAIFNFRIGKKIKSQVIIATAEDSRNDVVSTSAVLIAALISYFAHINLDGIMGTLVALFVLYSGIGLIKDAIAPLLGEAPDEELVNEIEKKIMSYEGVIGTHDLMVHDYGPGRRFASVHVEVPAERDVLECHELIDMIEEDFKKEGKVEVVIHYDPIVTSDDRVSTIREYLKNQVSEIDSNLSIHDLRLVPGEKNTNVIFDCVIPYSCSVGEDEVLKEIHKRLHAKYPDHTAVIKVDHSFVSITK